MDRTPGVLLLVLAVICFADALNQFSQDTDEDVSLNQILQKLSNSKTNSGLYSVDNKQIQIPDRKLQNADYLTETPLLPKRLDFRHYFAGIGKRIDPGIRFAGLGKRTPSEREERERKLAAVLENLILKLDSEEARGSFGGGSGGIYSVSGESSGSLSSESSSRDNGSKRRYGNIYRGPRVEINRTVRRRPRRRRKYRVDPVMFWLGIGR